MTNVPSKEVPYSKQYNSLCYSVRQEFCTSKRENKRNFIFNNVQIVQNVRNFHIQKHCAISIFQSFYGYYSLNICQLFKEFERL